MTLKRYSLTEIFEDGGRDAAREHKYKLVYALAYLITEKELYSSGWNLCKKVKPQLPATFVRPRRRNVTRLVSSSIHARLILRQVIQQLQRTIRACEECQQNINFSPAWYFSSF